MKLPLLMALYLCLAFSAGAANTPGLNSNYYEGTWNTLPDFNTLTPVKKLVSTNVTLAPRNREIQYAFLWQGYITIPAAGNYTFETYSDDGSRLYIGTYGFNTTPVVNNDGEHASQFVTGTIALNAGVYPISISFFQSYGGQTMEVYWSSNTGISRQKIGDNVLTANDPTVTTAPPVTTPPSGAANNYYFSAVTGDDSRSPSQALNPATPWKTIKKLNSYMLSLKAGDSILFKRGETFTGAIIMATSGTASLPIIFSAYGTGSKPVINGLAMLTSWVSVGNGAWEANCNSGTELNMVLINNVVKGMGRFPNIIGPNRGYLNLESHSGTSQLTDNELGSSVNWKGAEIVVRKNDWVLDRGIITNHSGNTLNYVSPTAHEPRDGYGYFIQNSPLTLDQAGEWYYNPLTKKLRIFFGTNNPSIYSIKASIIDTLVYINNNSYITFDNICFNGGDVEAFRIKNSSNIRIQNSSINYSGLDGISAENSPYVSVENNSINYSNNSGMRFYTGSSYASIKNNSVKNSGIIPGMGSSNNQQYDGIFVDSSPYNVIELNTVDSSGYCGITFTGDNITIKNNVVNYFCLTTNDGGGIYTWGGWDKVGRKVINNMVLNGIGAPAGTNSPIPNGAVGIYTDDRSTNIDISNNTIANCIKSGIFLHNSHEMNVTGNTLYNNGMQFSMVHDDLEPSDPIKNITSLNNIFSSNNANRFLIETVSNLNDLGSFGTFDNNSYLRPMDDNGIITANALIDGQYKNDFYNLSGWSLKYVYDQHSTKSPVKIPAFTVNKLIGANKYVNGAFNSNVDGVNCQSSPGKGTASFNSGGKLDGGALQVSFDAYGGPSNNVGIYLDFGAVTAGKYYLVSFSLLSAAPGKTIKAFILQNGGGYNKLSEIKFFELTTTRTENQFLFKAPSTETNAMIALELSGSDCPFWLDNLLVNEADITVTNPDDYMRFEYNATSKTKTVTLNSNYVDANNKLYSGKITLNPFTSVILIKQSTTTTTQSANQIVSNQMTATEMVNIKSQETIAMTVKLSPNPASEKLQVAVNLPESTRDASITIYSLSGIKIKTIPLSVSTKIIPVDVSNLNNGVYIVNINYDGQVITKKFLKQS